MKKCGNCKHRAFNSWSGIDFCMWYEMSTSEADEIENAKDCMKYEEGIPSCWADDDDEYYTPSATAGDYSPSCPWKAPGCSKSMFI